MKQESSDDGAMVAQRRPSLSLLLRSDVAALSSQENDASDSRNTSTTPPSQYGSPKQSNSNTCTTPTSGEGSPYHMSSPWSQSSPYVKSPWMFQSPIIKAKVGNNGLIGSVVREEGHVYSLAAAGDLLYTGSDSKNIRVWKNFKDYTGFKSSSGLVKAIVIYGDRIFTGHQDGKIRIWKTSSKNPTTYKRIGTLPAFKEYITKAVNPKNYVEARRKKNVLFIKHYDAVSCLSLNEEQGLLYSGSWDKTLKVWRLSDNKCLESINAHSDAINSVATGFDSLVFTGSADGTVKMWRRELEGNKTKHCLIQILLQQETAVTALAVNQESAVIYCGSSDGLVNFWEREKHLSHGGVLRGHKMAVLCLATAGNLVCSGSADKTICVWKREVSGDHTCLTVLSGHGGPVKCLAVEEDQESDKGDQRWIVYSGSLDKSVKVWRVSENVPDWREYNSNQYQSPRQSVSSMAIASKGR